MEKLVSVPVGVEAWRNCNAGPVAYRFYDPAGRETVRLLPGGQILRITAEQRQILQDSVIRPENDIFVNGTLKRVDNRIAESAMEPVEAVAGLAPEVVVADGKTSLPAGYDPARAIDNEALMALFKKSGTVFQAAVSKLDEGRVRRLLEAASAEDTVATVAQQRFLQALVAEKFAHGKSSRTVLELQSDARR